MCAVSQSVMVDHRESSSCTSSIHTEAVTVLSEHDDASTCLRGGLTW